MFRARGDKQLRKTLARLASGFKREEDRYQVQEVLGAGGFGEVLLCFDRQLNRQVARKVLRATQGEAQLKQVSLMLNEARLIGYIDHPGVVPLYDIAVSKDGDFSYTMKLLKGHNLREYLLEHWKQQGPLPLSRGVQIFTKLCETMAYAHEKGVLHLDLKPANIMVGDFGEVMIVDWGAARLYDPGRYEAYLEASGVSLEGHEIVDHVTGMIGSVLHMPFEQMTQPREQLRPSADIFAAGTLLYMMFAQRAPFSATDVQSYGRALLERRPQPLKELRDDLPPQLSDICMKMLALDPADRYQDLLELLDDLQELSNAGRRFPTHRFEPGEILIHQGDIGDFAMRILEGEVEITMEVEGEPRRLATCQSGEIVGEIAIFSEQLRMATVTALVPTVVQVLRRDDIELELEKLPPWISQMIQGLSHKFVDRQRGHFQKP